MEKRTRFMRHTIHNHMKNSKLEIANYTLHPKNILNLWTI